MAKLRRGSKFKKRGRMAALTLLLVAVVAILCIGFYMEVTDQTPGPPGGVDSGQPLQP